MSWRQALLLAIANLSVLLTTTPSPPPTPLPTSVPITIATTGDLMLGRSVNTGGIRRQDFTWSYRDLAPFLAQFDYTIANLENPIIADCPSTDEGMIFCAPAAAATALPTSGIDLFTLANNHTLNHGAMGLTQTQQLLTTNGLSWVGENYFHQTQIGEQTLGFLAYDDVSHQLNLPQITAEISRYATQVDHLLVAVHFGVEYTHTPTARQVEFARAAIDAGARIVIGNHPHWFQHLELYGSGAIAYSHGNFVFDQMWSQPTLEGIVVSWQLAADRIEAINIYPTYISDYGHVELLPGGDHARRILTQVQTLSNLGTIQDERVLTITPQ